MSTDGQKLDDPSVMELTGKILIATIIALFLVLVLVFVFHLYAKWLWHRRQQGIDAHGLNNRRQHHSSGVTVLRRGLDASFLKTIPVVELDPKHLKEGLECAVCLSELQQGERSRILPKCNHVFHAECIDMWFHSHATCPICRNPVNSDQTDKISVESLLEEVEESRNMSGGDFPTNMLFWGDETEVSTLTSQLDQEAQGLESSSSSSSLEEDEEMNNNNNDRAKPDLVIDIPSASSRRHEGDDEKTPVLSRMQSLRRMLSSGSRFNPFSPSNAQQTNC